MPDAGAKTSASGCSPARSAKVGSELRSFAVPGATREYELTVPRGYDGRSRTPLLLSLHGFTSNIAEQDHASRFPSQAGRRGYLVVTPQALDVDVPLQGQTLRAPLWNIAGAFVAPTGDQNQLVAGDDVGFIFSLLDRLERTLCVDTRREYVSGISNGAGMTVVLICRDDQRFAAAAPVAGVNMATLCGATHATPVIAFHGDADPLVSYQGGDLFGYDLGLPPVEKRMTHFAKLGGCKAKPRTTKPFTDVRHITWNCPKRMGAELYVVIGGGHTWPGLKIGKNTTTRTQPNGQDVQSMVGHQTTNIDATKLMLNFFDAHHRRG